MIDLRSKLILKNREGSYQVSIMTFSVITIDSGEELNDHSKGIQRPVCLDSFVAIVDGEILRNMSYSGCQQYSW